MGSQNEDFTINSEIVTYNNMEQVASDKQLILQSVQINTA